MRILVTGSEGGIGRVLQGALSEAGHELRTFDLVAAQTSDHAYVQGDLRDFNRVRDAVRGVDAVVHAGAIPGDIEGHADKVLTVNVQGTWNILLACTEAGVGRVVFFSSIHALGLAEAGHPTRFPIRDSDAHHALSPYQLSKHLGEEMCRVFTARHGIVTVCLRPVWVTYPEQYVAWRLGTQLVPEWIRAGYGAYVDVRDVCAAVLRSLEIQGVSHDAFLLSANDTVLPEPTTAYVDRYYPGSAWPWVDRVIYVAHNPHRSLIDCSHAEAVLGWRCQHSWRGDAASPGNIRAP